MSVSKHFPEKISIAPMMDVTDRHYRYFMRLITRCTVLYTEMVHTNQIIQGDAKRFLQFNVEEDPVVLQLGGSDPVALARCARLAEQWGYNAVNLNVGCPSERVQKGSFGACLMKQKPLVAECMDAMRQAVQIPVTMKTRLGVDEFDDQAFFFDFIHGISETGCRNFIIHARKAWLKGLNPKQNRSVPPLNYQRVYDLKKTFPHLNIILNGGIKTLDEITRHLNHVDGVMLGREAYNQPRLFAEVDQRYFDGDTKAESAIAILERYFPYVQQQLGNGAKLNHLIRPILGLFHGLPGGKHWRGFLTTEAHKNALGLRLLQRSMALVSTKIG